LLSRSSLDAPSGFCYNPAAMEPTYYPSFDAFKRLARKGNMVPVYRQLLGDTLTPVSAFQKIADESATSHAFLLESAAGPEKIGRYSFLGAEPFGLFKCRRDRVEVISDGKAKFYKAADPLAELEKLMRRFRPVHTPDLPRFTSGAVGYLAYDVVRYVEHLPKPPPDTLRLPDVYFMLYDLMLVFDHLNKTLKVVCTARTDGLSASEAYERATARIDAVIQKLRTPVETLTDDITPRGEALCRFSSNFTKRDYEAAVLACKEYIKAGDIFQVVLSQRLHTRTTAAPFDIYRTLRVVNPSPYMFYLKLGDLRLVGSSPEVMVKVENRKVVVRPIAGTRPRGKTDEEDVALAEELIADPKERAEHIMLVDLGRNDVGRVAQYRTVKIDDCMVIERYSHVMHITSQVSGLLRDDKTAFDALRSCIPAGTLSGAPKVRAMEILDELEPERRGPYGGAVGYLDFSGNMDTCITIRTIVLKGQDAYVQAGGGLVADSVPEREYQETLNKAKALLRAIEVAEKRQT